MFDLILVIVRTIAAALLLVLAASKLINVDGTSDRIWWPHARRSRTVLVIVSSIIEVTYAVVLVLVPPRLTSGSLWSTAALFMALTLYGLQGLRRIGDCGCSSLDGGPQSERVLIIRNVVIFGFAAAGVGWGPNLEEMAARPELLAASALAPVLLWIVLVVVLSGTRGRSSSSLRFSMLRRRLEVIGS